MKARAVIIALAIAVFTVWLYWPCTANGFLHWDDEPYIAHAMNHAALSLDTVRWAFSTRQLFYYHPLTLLSHALDYRFWGGNPAGHHATNVVLHALNSSLVFWLAWMLSAGDRERFAVATGVALVFAIHPLQVESVAWVAERKNVLCGFFSLATLCAYVRGWRWATLGLFAAALLAKPMAVSLPVVMLALDFYPLRRQAAVGWQRLLVEKLPFVMMAAGLAGLTVWAQSEMGAMMKLGGRSLADRSLIATRGMVFYLWKLAWPAWLSPYYPLAGVVSLRQAEYWMPLTAVVMISAVSVWTARQAPGVLAAWVAFVASILPVSGLMQAGSQAAADRFMYLAMLPVLGLMAAACVWVWRQMKWPGRSAVAVLLVCELAFLALRARGQMFAWRNDETMWRSVLTSFPDSGLANQGLSQALLDQARIDEALGYAQHAVAVAPWVGEAHGALANVWLKAGRYEEAVREARRALQLNPSLPQPLFVLACAYTRLRDFDAAYENLRAFLSARPDAAPYVASEEALAEWRDNPQFQQRFRELVGTKTMH